MNKEERLDESFNFITTISALKYFTIYDDKIKENKDGKLLKSIINIRNKLENKFSREISIFEY